MQQRHSIRAKKKRRFKLTTDSNNQFPVTPNTLNCEFTVAGPDKVWVGDITSIATDEGELFLVVLIDMFRRQGVVSSLREDMSRQTLSSMRCA